ncbi:hypothetical protein [Dokdonella fugitiva]|uniref:Uncharacterized protein n=1 Tax=Dokdonella fugitiva TaxID=328517 RepID=A0A4R2IBN8_9GAMM|nr:hypothetical protein [Dokdonella fugitiva]MBA8883935.1 hypothetical protein [Dokdonella fugitiva]TCO41923.1 hypothetical protein EV148_102277 [Dokdonella fugitiva]
MLSLLAATATGPQTHLTISPCRIGEHQQFDVASCDIEFKNDGDKPITISKGEAALPWDMVEKGAVVPAHGTSYIKATVDLRDSVGFVKRSFRFATSEPGQLAVRGASVHAFVSTVLDQVAPKIDFEAVKLSGPMPTKSISLSSREVADFRILSITEKPAYVDARVGDDGRTVYATLRKDAPWGLQHEKIKLRTNVPQQPQAWISVDVNVIGDVAPSGNPFSFGLMRTNANNEFLLRLTSESGKDFKVATAKLDGIKGRVDVTACVVASPGCRMLRIQVANDQQRGRLQGTLLVELPEFHRTLPIEVVGMLLPPDYVVHDFEKDLEKSGQAASITTASPSTGAPAGIDLKQAIKQQVHRNDSPPPAGDGPLLKWSVANEGTVYAYIIYRSDSESGPFVRVNKELIRAADDEGNAFGTYQYRDNSAVPGRTYWYQIGTVKGTGEKAPLSGAQKVVAK